LVEQARVVVHHVDGSVEGLVLNWRTVGGVLQGLVTYELRDRIVTDWVPAMSLSPLEETSGSLDEESDGDAVPSA
jgi:hypothetical protein